MAKGKIRSKRKYIFILLLAILILFLLFLFFRYLFVNRIVSSSEIALDSEEGNSLIYKAKAYSYFDRLGEYEASSLSNQEKLWFVVETDEYYHHHLQFYQENNTISGSDVEDFFSSYFYQEELSLEDIKDLASGKTVFSYSKDQNSYQLVPDYTSSNSEPVIYDKYFYPISIEKKQRANQEVFYEIKAHRMFGDSFQGNSGITEHFYGTYEDALQGKHALINAQDYDHWLDYFTSEEKIEQLYQEKAKEFPVYTYTLLYEDGNYSLQSVKISK